MKSGWIGIARRALISGAVAVAVFSGGTFSVAFAQECPSLIGSEDFEWHNAAPNDVVAVGGYAFTADLHGLTAYDVRDPRHTERVGELKMDGEATTILVSGNTAYVGGGSEGLLAVSIDDPTVPEVMWREPSVLGAGGIAIDGETLYVSERTGWLSILDLTDGAVWRIGFLELGSFAGDIAVADHVAYVAGGTRGLQVVDVSNPSEPVLLGSYDTPGFAKGVTVSGNVVYVADGDGGLETLDVSNPAKPLLLGSIKTGGDATKVELSGNVAFVADGPGGVQLIDVSDPETPVLLGSLATPGEARGISVSGTTIFVADPRYGLHVGDGSDTAAPKLLGSFDASGYAWDVDISQTHAFVADGLAGLQVVDISNPSVPALIGSLATPGEARGVTVSGETALVADGSSGLQIIDVGNSSSPDRLGSLDTPGFAKDVAISGTLAVVADGPSGLQVIDVSHPSAPVLLGSLDTPGEAMGVDVTAGVAYVADGDAGLQVIDISNPKAPVLLGTADMKDGTAYSVVVKDNLAYVAGGRYGLVIVDVTDPRVPQVLLGGPAGPDIRDVTIFGNLAYLAQWYYGVLVLDVSDPRQLQSIGEFFDPTLRSCRGIAVDPVTATVWMATGAFLKGVDVGCPSCAGLEVSADPATIWEDRRGSTITVHVTDPFGNPARAHDVFGVTDLGTLSELTYQGSGTYTATLTSSTEGTATVTIWVDWVECDVTTTVTILRCDSDPVAPPTGVTASAQGGTSVRVTWDPSSGAAGYRLERGGMTIAELDQDATGFTESGLTPGLEYCYTVAAVDACGDESTSKEVCATTPGSPPTCPVVAARSFLSHTNEANLRDVTVGNGLVFGADATGLGIWNVTDPAHPMHVAHWQAPEPAEGVAWAEGGVVALADGTAGVFLLDVRNPTRPVKLAKVPTAGKAWGVTVSGDLAYVADDTAGLLILDVSDPTQPRRLGSYGTPEAARGVAVVGHRAYMAVTQAGLQILDVADPRRPVLLGTLDTPGFAVRLAVSGTTAYVADGYAGLQIVDVTKPGSPSLLATYTSPWNLQSITQNVTVNGGVAYLANWSNGLEIVDVGDPTAPARLGFEDTPGDATAVVVAAHRAYVADGDAGLRIIDVSDPAAPAPAGAWEIRGWAGAVTLRGDTAYVADGEAGLQILDVSNAAAPVLLGSYDTPDFAAQVAVKGNTAFVADLKSGLQILDVSDPSSPQLLGSFTPEGSAFGITVDGSVAYLTGSQMGLQVLNVSDPRSPTLLASYPGIAGYEAVVDGVTLYIASNWGLDVFDVSDPTDPVLLTRYSDGGDVRSVSVTRNVASIALGWAVETLDISDRSSLRLLGTYKTEDSEQHVVAVGDVVYVSGNIGGLRILGISNPSAPELLASHRMRDFGHGLAVSGGAVVVAEGPVVELFTAECREPVAGFTATTFGLHMELRDASLYGPRSYQWDFGDGATSVMADPAHTYSAPGKYTVRLTVANGEGSDTSSRTVSVRAAPPGVTDPGNHVSMIPGSSHTAGLAGTSWVSDLVLWNGGPHDTTANLYFLKTGRDNSDAWGRQISVPSGAAVKLRDVVGGTFAGSATSGAILVGSDDPLVVTSRTYNDAPSGTFGQFIGGVPLAHALTAGQKGELIGLTRNGDYRTNIGFANATGKAITVDVDLRDAHGDTLGTRSYVVKPYGFYQKTDIIREDVSDAVAVIRSKTPGAAFFTYASVIDNRTGDPVFITPDAGVATAGESLYIPGSAHLDGAGGTHWRTDVAVYNPGTATATYTVELLKRGHESSTPEARTYNLSGGASVRYPDVLKTLFGFSGAAALRITPAVGGIAVNSRTYNQTPDGTFGQFIPAVRSVRSITAGVTAVLTQLSDSAVTDDGYRTNIGFVNTTGKTIHVLAELHSGDGAALGTKDVTLRAYEYKQTDRIFRSVTSATLANCYALLRTPGGAFLAYGSVVDNRSGDPVYVPAQVVAVAAGTQ